MKAGGKYYLNKTQACTFPMQTMGISQGALEGFSHKGRYALDLTGKDAGIESAYAPCDCEVVWKDMVGTKTGILIQSRNPVETPIGKYYTRHLLWHDNNIADLWVGKFIQQGERFYEEGTADYATGNHIHLMCAFGQHDGTYPLRKTIFGNWALKGQVHPEKVYFIDDTVIRNAKGYNWKKLSDKLKRYLYLDKSVKSWNVYPVDAPAVSGNQIGKLSPSAFGGLKYEIISELGHDLFTIQTKSFGLVKIYAGSDTKARIE